MLLRRLLLLSFVPTTAEQGVGNPMPNDRTHSNTSGGAHDVLSELSNGKNLGSPASFHHHHQGLQAGQQPGGQPEVVLHADREAAWLR